MSEESERKCVIDIANSWLRTPYRHMARVKGSGCDCITLLAEVYAEAGLIPRIDIPYYPMDWMHHRDSERYLNGLLEYAQEVDKPLPGDIVVWKIGRCFSHGAIVVDWPLIIHAQIERNVCFADAEAMQDLQFVGKQLRPRRYFSYWRK